MRGQGPIEKRAPLHRGESLPPNETARLQHALRVRLDPARCTAVRKAAGAGASARPRFPGRFSAGWNRGIRRAVRRSSPTGSLGAARSASGSTMRAAPSCEASRTGSRRPAATRSPGTAGTRPARPRRAASTGCASTRPRDRPSARWLCCGSLGRFRIGSFERPRRDSTDDGPTASPLRQPRPLPSRRRPTRPPPPLALLAGSARLPPRPASRPRRPRCSGSSARWPASTARPPLRKESARRAAPAAQFGMPEDDPARSARRGLSYGEMAMVYGFSRAARKQSATLPEQIVDMRRSGLDWRASRGSSGSTSTPWPRASVETSRRAC